MMTFHRNNKQTSFPVFSHEGGWNLHLGSISYNLSELRWTPLLANFSEASRSKACPEREWYTRFLSLLEEVITHFTAYSLTVWRWEVWNSVEMFCLRELWGRICSLHLPASGGPPGCGHITLISATIFMPPFPLRVLKTHHITPGDQLLHLKILNWITSAKAPFPNKVAFPGPGFGWQHIFSVAHRSWGLNVWA